MASGENFTLTPTVGVYYFSSKTNTFNTSLGRYGMKYSRDTFELPVEVTAKYDIEVSCDSTLSLIAPGGYSYSFRNKGTKIDSFNVAGLANQFGDNHIPIPDRSSWNASGGVQYRYRNVDFGVNYEYYGRNNYRSHNLNANVGVSFWYLSFPPCGEVCFAARLLRRAAFFVRLNNTGRLSRLVQRKCFQAFAA